MILVIAINRASIAGARLISVRIEVTPTGTNSMIVCVGMNCTNISGAWLLNICVDRDLTSTAFAGAFAFMTSGRDWSSRAIASIGDVCKVLRVDVLACCISRVISNFVLRTLSRGAGPYQSEQDEEDERYCPDCADSSRSSG